MTATTVDLTSIIARALGIIDRKGSYAPPVRAADLSAVAWLLDIKVSTAVLDRCRQAGDFTELEKVLRSALGKLMACTFCGKSAREVKRMVSGPSVARCAGLMEPPAPPAPSTPPRIDVDPSLAEPPS